VLVVRGFERSRAGAAPAGGARSMAVLVVAAIFSLLVYFAFTRGLDLPLPAAAWNR